MEGLVWRALRALHWVTCVHVYVHVHASELSAIWPIVRDPCNSAELYVRPAGTR